MKNEAQSKKSEVTGVQLTEDRDQQPDRILHRSLKRI